MSSVAAFLLGAVAAALVLSSSFRDALGSVAFTDYPALTEHGATLRGAATKAGRVYLHWGSTDAGHATASWQHSVLLGDFAAASVFQGAFDGQPTFQKVYCAFRVVPTTGGGNEEWSRTIAIRPQIQGILYATGFEPDELFPFSQGDLTAPGQGLAGVWTVAEGAASVEPNVRAQGLAGVQIDQGGLTLNRALGAGVLWLDAAVLPSLSDNPPMLPSGKANTALYFSASNGLLALDGDGEGGGVFAQIIPNLETNAFLRITLRMDYIAHRYDVWVNGIQRRTGLGFKDSTVSGFSGASFGAETVGWVDNVSLSTWGLDADSDGDGLNDLDEAKFYGSYPLLADSDGDGISDGDEVRAGTDPAEPAAGTALAIERSSEEGRIRVRIPTASGATYTLFRSESVQGGTWQPVPGAANIPGDNTVKWIEESASAQAAFYRLLVTRP